MLAVVFSKPLTRCPYIMRQAPWPAHCCERVSHGINILLLCLSSLPMRCGGAAVDAVCCLPQSILILGIQIENYDAAVVASLVRSFARSGNSFMFYGQHWIRNVMHKRGLSQLHSRG